MTIWERQGGFVTFLLVFHPLSAPKCFIWRANSGIPEKGFASTLGEIRECLSLSVSRLSQNLMFREFGTPVRPEMEFRTKVTNALDDQSFWLNAF